MYVYIYSVTHPSSQTSPTNTSTICNYITLQDQTVAKETTENEKQDIMVIKTPHSLF